LPKKRGKTNKTRSFTHPVAAVFRVRFSCDIYDRRQLRNSHSFSFATTSPVRFPDLHASTPFNFSFPCLLF
jgi:hypothetical protein